MTDLTHLLDRLSEVAEAATPGPWGVDDEDGFVEAEDTLLAICFMHERTSDAVHELLVAAAIFGIVICLITLTLASVALFWELRDDWKRRRDGNDFY